MRTIWVLTFLLAGASSTGCEDTAASEDHDSSGQAGRRDAGMRHVGTGAGPVRDGAAADDPRLAALAGGYLLRLDTIGDATSASALGTLGVHSLVSTLVVAQLKLEGGELIASERVCTQTFVQRCTQLCTAASSSLDPRVREWLQQRQQQRSYTLAADGTLRAGRSIAQLGYDDDDPDAPAPSEQSDARIWDLDDDAADRLGFKTTLMVTVGVPVSCTVYGTQKLVSSFAGKLGGSDEAPVLPVMALDLAQSRGFTVGSMPAGCAMMGAAAKVDEAKSNARMIRYPELGAELACPEDRVFDERLPATSL